MLAIDTLQTARRYREAGLTTEQAEAYTAILKDSHHESIENLASKDDIALVRKDLELLRKDMATKDEFALVRKDLELLRKDMQQETALIRKDMATKDEFASVKDELVGVKSDVSVMKWMLGILIAGVAALVLKAFFGA
ncbi:MAG: hypothetical protein QGF03_04850 [SAR324 cluster bacterium]|mgnify:FL=1|jgi:hypothetical protein|nr:hypothetical protein [SAR324 cluster bacterium]MDP7629901.1 hypothetical protein [SAR324 cluster bacterium]